jgi:hypothetical protein
MAALPHTGAVTATASATVDGGGNGEGEDDNDDDDDDGGGGGQPLQVTPQAISSQRPPASGRDAENAFANLARQVYNHLRFQAVCPTFLPAVCILTLTFPNLLPLYIKTVQSSIHPFT